ncbi:hypothetical protein GW17_00005553 [Ensete ventricosum]|nr:hypothetical protein GW17_00005553 [Ensete ventricosum]
MGAVGGVLLDESVLLSDDGSGNPRLKPGAEILLRRLRYSNLRVGFCHHEDLSAVKVEGIKLLRLFESSNVFL